MTPYEKDALKREFLAKRENIKAETQRAYEAAQRVKQAPSQAPKGTTVPMTQANIEAPTMSNVQTRNATAAPKEEAIGFIEKMLADSNATAKAIVRAQTLETLKQQFPDTSYDDHRLMLGLAEFTRDIQDKLKVESNPLLRMRWSRLSEQLFRVDKWSVCRG